MSMVIPKGDMFLKVKSETGEDIKFVVAAETMGGFLVILNDLGEDGFPKTLKTERKYCKFTLNE